MAHYSERFWKKKTADSEKKSAGYQDKINDIRYYSKKDEYDKAQALIEELSFEYPNDPGLMFEQAKVYQARGQNKKCEKIFKFLVEINSNNATTAKYELARLYSYSNRRDEAREICKSLLKEKYKTDLVTYMLGNIALMDGNMVKAKEYYKAAAPTCNLAQSRLNSLSKNDYSKANLTKDNITGNSNVYKGIIYWNDKIRNAILSNNLDDAINSLPEYERALNKNFSEKEIVSFIETVLLAGKVNYAEKMISKYKEQCEEETSNYLYGRLALAKGNYEDGAQILKSVKAGSKYFYASNFYLGMIAKQENLDELARFYFKIAEHEKEIIGTQAIERLLYMDIEHVDFVDATIQANKLKEIKNAGAIHVADQALEYISCNEGNPIALEGNHYSFEQMKEYDVARAIKHIKRHQDSEQGEKAYSSSFNKDADIREIYDYALDNLFPSNLCYYDLCHHYVLYYPKVGNINDKPVDYIEVVTLPVNKYGARNILTMYPVAGKYNEITKVINDEEIETQERKEDTKVKELSTIDKFNKRYGFK